MGGGRRERKRKRGRRKKRKRRRCSQKGVREIAPKQRKDEISQSMRKVTGWRYDLFCGWYFTFALQANFTLSNIVYLSSNIPIILSNSFSRAMSNGVNPRWFVKEREAPASRSCLTIGE